MVFSSIIFIYYFLPIVLILYFISPKKYKNMILLLTSLAFYFYGEPKLIIILILSAIINYLGALLIEKNYSKKILFVLVSYNILQLMYFKYMNFFIDNINSILKLNINHLNVIMPIGISFFTFQALGYVIDVYNKKHGASKSLLNFMMYLSFFPQLIAGPIVRYSDIETQVINREHSFDKFADGVSRFVFGMAKKVLIANVLGELIESLKVLNSPSIASFWLIAISFTLQIYFDFSAYSDMAIGLGKMFGFDFLENFNYPFMATSITDFWRRWHISLSSFFKDYVYIPLGGSRVTYGKYIRNIMIVWLLTGFWHGAAYNFIIWGLYFALLLIIEKRFLLDKLHKTILIKHIYTLFLVVISFTIFNAESLNELSFTLKSMFGFSGLSLINHETIYYLRSYGLILVLGIMFSTNVFSRYKKLDLIILPILLLLSTGFLIDSSFNPFLYFRF